jgi:hypothetical protein
MSRHENERESPSATTPALWIALLLTAVVGSALATVAGRSDVLTGRAPATVRPTRDCSGVPAADADPSPLPPANAIKFVFGLLPTAPVADLQDVKTLGFSTYATASDYVGHSPLLLPGAIENALEQNGFKTASTIGYEHGTTVLGVEAFELGSPAQAAAFSRQVLLEECRTGAAAHLRPLPGLVDGVAFAYHQPSHAPFRAAFVVGDTAVRLNLCVCRDDGGDPYALLAGWANGVDARMREPI